MSEDPAEYGSIVDSQVADVVEKMGRKWELRPVMTDTEVEKLTVQAAGGKVKVSFELVTPSETNHPLGRLIRQAVDGTAVVSIFSRQLQMQLGEEQDEPFPDRLPGLEWDSDRAEEAVPSEAMQDQEVLQEEPSVTQ